jgi:hypothetical protein
MELALEDFEDAVVVRLQEALTAPEIDNNAIVAHFPHERLTGFGELREVRARA